MTGPKAKRIWKKNKNIETQRRILGKYKVTKEEKMELAERELKKKDRYTKRNCTGYKQIYPAVDNEELELE